MKLFTTTIQAIDPLDGELKLWGGPNVPAISFNDARRYCNENGLGYCTIFGELVATIPTNSDERTPDFSKMIDYSNDN
jgi:hypothetical protein